MLAKIVWSWILKVCIKVQEKKTSVVVLLKREIRQFFFVIVQRRHGNTQKRDARAKLLFCFDVKPIVFFFAVLVALAVVVA